MDSVTELINLAQQAEVENKRKKINRFREERGRRDWQHILASPQGRRVVWELLNACGYDSSAFHNESQITAYNCGRQAVGLFIRERIYLARPEALLQMRQEYESELKSQERELYEEKENA